VSRFLTAHHHNYAVQCHSHWFTLENTEQKTRFKIQNAETKHNPEEKNNAKRQNKTSLV